MGNPVAVASYQKYGLKKRLGNVQREIALKVRETAHISSALKKGSIVLFGFAGADTLNLVPTEGSLNCSGGLLFDRQTIPVQAKHNLVPRGKTVARRVPIKLHQHEGFLAGKGVAPGGILCQRWA